MTDTTQFSIYIRGIYFNVTEEIAALYPMKRTKKSFDILNALKLTLKRYDLKLNNLSGIITYGAPSMVIGW